MTQLHKRFQADQIKVLLSAYEAGHLSREEIERTLGIGKTRFFALRKQFRDQPELQREKALVENQELPISSYNYAALNDRLKKSGIQVSTTTIIKRAIQQGCYLPKKKKKDRHDREVLTSAVGDLIQHDASLHKWSPFAAEKWTLITSLDDHSRMLYADFVETETSWAHIQSARSLMQQFGVPHRYYVDNLRVFRFIQHRDSLWKNLVLGTNDVNTQWRQVLALMNTDVIYALSPQAKGKIERPYRWLQDRIVRTCALEHITTLTDARPVLREEVHRYNYQQVHSTTGEIPALRFEKHNKSTAPSFVPLLSQTPFLPPRMSFACAIPAPRTVIARSPLLDMAFRSLALHPGMMSISTSSRMNPKT